MESSSHIRVLSDAEVQVLVGVIREAEKKTSANLRLMIVKRSAMTGHVHLLLWGLLVSLTALFLCYPTYAEFLRERWWVLPSVLLAHYLLAGLLSRLQGVQRLLTSHHDLHHQVWARAEVEFHRLGLSDGRSHTGVLLFVSLMERQALVLAGKSIADKLPPHVWDQVVKTVIDGARTGSWAEKLGQALRECGGYLAEHFPGRGEKLGEAPKVVILKD